MTKIETIMQMLHHDENEVAAAFTRLADEHGDDHEIFFVARELATWSGTHLALLRTCAERYDVDLDDDTPGSARELLDHAGEEVVRIPGEDADPGLVLLRQLRGLHVACVGLSLDWETLAQTAKALRDDELQSVAERCQSDAVRQMKWSNAKIKESAPQIMAS